MSKPEFVANGALQPWPESMSNIQQEFKIINFNGEETAGQEISVKDLDGLREWLSTLPTTLPDIVIPNQVLTRIPGRLGD